MDTPGEKPSRIPRPPLPRNVKLLGWASFLNDVASEMVFPLLPQFLATLLGANRAYLGTVLGAIEGLADSVASLLKLASGGWSDRIGARKGLVVLGYGIAAVVRPLIGLLAAPWQLLAVRVGDRIGKGIRTSPRDACIAESAAAEIHGRAFGFQRAMDHLGAVLGPLVAFAFLAAWPGRFRPLFLLTLLPGILVVALLAFGLREQRAAPRSPEKMSWTLKPFGPGFRLYLLALAVFTLGNSSDAFLLVRAGDLEFGIPAEVIPLLWCAFHVVKSGGNYVAGHAVDRIGPRPMILAGWALYGAVYLGFALSTQAWHVWALFAAYALFYALTEPAEKTLVASLVGSQQRGLAYGWFNLAVSITTLPANLIFGTLYDRLGPLAAFGWGAAMAAAAAAIFVFVRVKDSTRGPRS